MKISVLEVNLTAIKNNLANVRKLLKYNQKVCVVAKANCYGFGAKEVCKNLNKFADYFAVSSAKEFYEIRKVASKPIVILDPIYKGLKRLIKSGAEITISNFESLQVLLKEMKFLNKIVKVHIAVNTGMNRFGFKTKIDIFNAISILKKSQKITIIGIFSHYFDANNEKFANLQYNKFLEIKRFCKDNFDLNCIYHLANSNGIIYKNGFDMVRAGMVIYGDKSYQTITLKSKILDIQNLSKNETAGYSAVFVAREQKRLAIVGIGYGDGIMRNIVKNGYVLINGKYAKIVAICMDTMLVDITKIDAKICDDVVLIGRSKNKQIFICDMASWCDTIDYEIIVRLSNRIERRYVS